MAKQGIFQENEEKNADFYVIKHISHKHFQPLSETRKAKKEDDYEKECK